VFLSFREKPESDEYKVILTELMITIKGTIDATGVHDWNHLFSFRESAHYRKKNFK
jgi:hypothetical protein